MAAGDLTVANDLTVSGATALTGALTTADGTLVTNLNADKVDGADRDTDGTLAGNSDTSVPTEKAVKTYVDAHKNTETAGVHGSTSAATASKPMHRDASGRSKVAAPAAADDIARKDTVDTHAALAVAGTHGSTVAATPNRSIHRDAAGRAKVVAPAVAGDIALKDTVDTHAALTTAGTHGSTVAATANKVIHRDASGRAQVAAPSAAADIANKGYVDAFLLILHVREEQTSGTGGGGNVGDGSWETRTLNTVKLNEISGASLGSNQITLPAGTYLLTASIPSCARTNIARLRNITDSSTVMLSTGNTLTGTGQGPMTVHLNVKFTIAGSKVLEIQQKFDTSVYAYAKGVPHSLDTEVYTEVLIYTKK